MARLGYGYNAGLPANIARAWGARAIVTQQGMVDLVYNRQGWIGEPGETQALQDWLNGGAIAAARSRATAALKDYEIRTNEAGEATLYEDEVGVIKANTNASHGYLYICGYLKADAAAIDPNARDLDAEFDDLDADYAGRVAKATDLIQAGEHPAKVFAAASLTIADADNVLAEAAARAAKT